MGVVGVQCDSVTVIVSTGGNDIVIGSVFHTRSSYSSER